MKTALFFVIFTVLFLNCSSNNSEPILIEIEEDFSSIENPKERWEAYELEDYYIEQGWSCECIQPYGVEIYVKGGSLLNYSFENFLDEELQSEEEFAVTRISTIEKAFRLIDEYQNVADTVIVEYHPKFGYPTSLKIDKSFRIADEEVSYTFQGLKRVIQY
ncbi:MAG: DUF6174 domain-containing protein [Balneola sp.]